MTPQAEEASGGAGRPSRPGRPPLAVAFLASLLLLAGAMVLPWWTLGSTGPAATAGFEYGLTALCVRPSGACTAYGSLSTPAERAVGGIFAVALGLTSAALLGTLLAFILSLVRRFQGGPAGAVVGLASGAAALAGPLYVFATLPSAVASIPYASVVSGFFGAATSSSATVSWGGGAGWGLCLAAGALLVIGSLGGLVAGRRRRQSS